MAAPQRRPDAKEFVKGLRAGDRTILSRAITLVESTRDEDRALAQSLLDELSADAPTAARIGITGVPGAGKSTFIDALGDQLAGSGRRVAVLAVDPSSETTGGSILGDKTRMERLSRNANAYVRPSPAGHGAGGVAPRTREAMLLCEAAGFDKVLIETVGTGQSELGVAISTYDDLTKVKGKRTRLQLDELPVEQDQALRNGAVKGIRVGALTFAEQGIKLAN